MNSVMDPRLIRREFYNREKFDVAIECDVNFKEYVLAAGITWLMPSGKHAHILKSGEWCTVNHSYVTVTGIDKYGRAMPIGTPINLLESFGNNIGRGFKNPSLPILDAQWMKKERK